MNTHTHIKTHSLQRPSEEDKQAQLLRMPSRRSNLRMTQANIKLRGSAQAINTPLTERATSYGLLTPISTRGEIHHHFKTVMAIMVGMTANSYLRET